MALFARQRGVSSGERILCEERVVKFCVKPTGCRVARSTVVGQAQLNMRRIFAVGEIRGVATIAIGRSSLIHIVQMARGAG